MDIPPQPTRDKTSLRDEVRSYRATFHAGPICSVCKLPKELLDEVNSILREDGACHAALTIALKRRGIHTSRQRLGHHYRNGHHELA